VAERCFGGFWVDKEHDMFRKVLQKLHNVLLRFFLEWN